MKVNKEAEDKGKTPTKVKVRREKEKGDVRVKRRFSMTNHIDSRLSTSIQSLFSGRYLRQFFPVPLFLFLA